ncbi:P-loop containing nucleoside triphosphate hydrolase protein [Boletus edulis BED1]|uniref:P-loop containing nucleoside triphosphate hydrolase protein n=1 Tax=Boletus edulis BED1 TaxID=1328754 RepID=A0AAD4BVM9_BOLED|nr:P-loop containing nucleoside triphosphate hydrolase protein [Boletus edulis BED1]
MASRDVVQNIVIFGETGSGKSSLVNLIMGQTVAATSYGTDGCTLDSTLYETDVGEYHLRIYDTVGLNEPRLGAEHYLAAIEKAHRLITALNKAGGVHLLVFCVRGGRITATTQHNYRLFYEFLCCRLVPVALVITNLESETPMESWWQRNSHEFTRFGINAVAHACVTCTPGYGNMYADKYEESKTTISDLLVKCATQHAYTIDTQTWFTNFSVYLRQFVSTRHVHSKKQMVRMLVLRCGMSADDAEVVVRRVEQGGLGNSQWKMLARCIIQ